MWIVLVNLPIVLLLLAGTFFMGRGMVRWICKPLDALPRARHARTQFTLADMLILFPMLQLFVGTVHFLMAGAVHRIQGLIFVVDGLAAVIVLCCWWCGVSMASRAGIHEWWHRAVILAVVVPCGTVSVAGIVFLMFLGMTIVAHSPEKTPLILGIGCAMLTVVGVCGQLTRWIAARYAIHEPAAPLDAENAAQSSPKSVEE